MLPQVFLERMQGLLGSEYEEFLVSFDQDVYKRQGKATGDFPILFSILL